MDTIYALATAQGRAGVAIIRVSGPDAFAAAERLAGALPAVRGVRILRDDEGEILDEALVLRFAAGHSFTGEDVVELHLHGSPAIVAAVQRELGDIPGLRMAEAGEFTRRAMENGTLDLAQVEGLADLIDAETEAQRKQALRVFSGRLGEMADGWRRDLIRAAALIEAAIDFVDEDVPVDVTPEVRRLVAKVRGEMASEAAGVGVAERIRDGFEVAIIGPPNAGKSTLLNRLAGRDVAITSAVAGTTRDVIEVRMDLGGLPVTMLDTAGLRETEDEVERIGVARARARSEASDLRIHLVGAESDVPDWTEDDLFFRGKQDETIDERGISGLTGAGLDNLIKAVSDRLSRKAARAGVAMRARHRDALERAVRDLDAAMRTLESDPALADIVAEDLRSAIRAVDGLVGRIDVEHVLDEIFSSFCIGK